MWFVNTVAGVTISFTVRGVFFYIGSIALRSPKGHRTAYMSLTSLSPTVFCALQDNSVIQSLLVTVPTQDRMVRPRDFEAGQK